MKKTMEKEMKKRNNEEVVPEPTGVAVG